MMEAQAGLKIRSGDGTEEPGNPEMMSTTFFYWAEPGDRLRLKDYGYTFNVATYAPEIDPAWLYTYAYAPDQCWAQYRNDLSGGSYRQAEYIFDKRVYFRVCVRKTDGGMFDGSEDIDRILAFEGKGTKPYASPSWLPSEAARVSESVKKARKPGDLCFALLTDSHYTVNGTWEDTAAGINAVHRALGLDGIIHLGDLTDGTVTAAATRRYASVMLAGLRSAGTPVWAALGNHDSNYFNGNQARLSLEEQCGLYLRRETPRYVAEPSENLRFIVLDSFDPAEVLRYGYTPACIDWLDERLKEVPKHTRVIVLSHIPPVTRLQYWSKSLRGESALMDVLNKHEHKVIAFLNGHNHADRLDNAEGFPIVSIGNAKCEAFYTHKTEGFVTPRRTLGDASQELWDVMLVTPGEGRIRFVRFGAGGDRIIENGKVEWL